MHRRRLGLVLAMLVVFSSLAHAQAMFTASVGQAFGGDAPSARTSWAIAIGGGGAHHIGSEIEFAEIRHFFQDADGTAHGRVLALMPSLFVAVPAGPVRPYGIVGFGFIRQRTRSTQGGVLSNLTDDDIGYSVGGGVIVKVARHAGLRADLRRFRVRKSDGLRFNRFMVGLVLGG